MADCERSSAQHKKEAAQARGETEAARRHLSHCQQQLASLLKANNASQSQITETENLLAETRSQVEHLKAELQRSQQLSQQLSQQAADRGLRSRQSQDGSQLRDRIQFLSARLAQFEQGNLVSAKPVLRDSREGQSWLPPLEGNAKVRYLAPTGQVFR